MTTLTIVKEIGEYVSGELIHTKGGVPNRICFAVPGSIAWDDCHCGQLAQTITSISPAESGLTSLEDAPIQGCGPGLAIVNVTLSLTRCVPTIDDSGNSPTPDELFTAAEILEDDRASVHKSLFTHLKTLRGIYKITDYSIGTATTVGPDGMCAGVEVTYSFGISSNAMHCG